MPEARLDDSGSGLAPASDGWFVVNVRDAQWLTAENAEKRPPGSDCRFESQEFPFPQVGIKLRVLEPGQPNGLYHSESQRRRFSCFQGNAGCSSRRGAAPRAVGLLPQSRRDRAHLRGRRRRAVRLPDRRRTAGERRTALPGVGARGALRGERQGGDVRLQAGVRAVRAVTSGASLVLGPPPLE